MPLSAGTRLGVYEVIVKIGEGGMGEVYRARDTTLNREVALKILPDLLAADPERLARFAREAQTLASLNHQNIGAIYGLEESSDTRALVLELVEGSTLADRIAEGPIPPNEAVTIATQIAQALAAAHAQDVVHRDLKPANIKLRPDGMVKVLDFGLAKGITRELARPGQTQAITVSAPQTMEGVVVGTPPYMSPEQIRGHTLDARSDIWAFGCVVYEMLSGQRTFDGGTPLATMAAILEREPDWNRLPQGTPAALVALLKRCFEREQSRRLSDLANIEREIAEPASADVPHPTRPSIAVLPFADMSAAKDQDYFCEGLAEELIGALSRLDGLRVVARSSAFRFKGSAHDLRRIGTELAVGTVLEGSVRKAGNRLRITAQLVDTESGSHAWSERYDRELEDIFAIQDEIARAVAERLRVTLLGGATGPLVKRSTKNLQAYTAYMRGRHYRFNRYSASKAHECHEEAVRHDPGYALAWAGLADAAVSSGYLAAEPAHDAAPRARTAVERALALDENLSEAHSALARIHLWFDWRWTDAEREFRLAVSLNPANTEAYTTYASFLAVMGRTDEALGQIAKAREVDPLSAHAALIEGFALEIGRRYDESIDALHKALDLQPNMIGATWNLAFSYHACARHEEAVRVLENVSSAGAGLVAHDVCLGRALGLAGRTEDAEAVLERLSDRSRREYVSPHALANVYLGLGQIDQALNQLELAFRERSPGLIFLQRPTWDAVRPDPRFQDLVRRIGLPDIEAGAGAPPRAT